MPAIALLLTILTLPTLKARATPKDPDHVAFSLIFPQFTLGVTEKLRSDAPEDAEPAEVFYDANIQSAFGLSASWKGLSAGYAFTIPRPAAEEGDEPETRSTFEALELGFFLSRVGIDVSRTSLKGADLRDAAAPVETRLRPDIALATRGANLWVNILSLGLDLDAALDPTAPGATGLAVLALGSYDELSLELERDLVEGPAAQPFGGDVAVREGRFQSLSGQFGLALAGHLGFGLHASLLLTTGSGTQTTTYKVGEESRSETRTTTKTNAYVSVGYKGPRHFLVADLSMDEPTYVLETLEIAPARGFVRLVYGFRH